MIAVTFALPNESADLARRVRDRKDIRVWHTGVGEAEVRRRLPNLMAQEKPALLISSGFAGAVTDQLSVGDLFLAENFSDETLLKSFVSYQRGVLATAPSVIDSAEERAAFAQEKGAQAVDMETEMIAQICAEHSVPMISLRAISDTPVATFGFPMSVLFDVETQRVPIARLLMYLVRRSAINSITQLVRLSRQVATAREALARGLAEAIELLAR